MTTFMTLNEDISMDYIKKKAILNFLCCKVTIKKHNRYRIEGALKLENILNFGCLFPIANCRAVIKFKFIVPLHICMYKHSNLNKICENYWWKQKKANFGFDFFHITK